MSVPPPDGSVEEGLPVFVPEVDIAAVLNEAVGHAFILRSQGQFQRQLVVVAPSVYHLFKLQYQQNQCTYRSLDYFLLLNRVTTRR